MENLGVLVGNGNNEGPRNPGGQQDGHETAVCLCGQEDQWYPGMFKKKKKHDQQVVGSGSTPLLCPGEATFRLLYPLLVSQLKEDRDLLGVQ